MSKLLPYELADRAIAALNRKAVKRLEQCKETLQIKGFDELNVLQSVKTMYRNLDGDNRKAFHRLFIDRYAEVYQSVKHEKPPEEDELEEIAELFLARMLGKPDPVTRYAYDAEVPRKQDRCAESVIAANGATAKQEELNKSIRFWSQMTGQYADNISDGANERALKDAGIKYVKWHTQEDERVCSTCGRRDGKLYPIGRVPDAPHWRCRCYVSVP